MARITETTIDGFPPIDTKALAEKIESTAKYANKEWRSMVIVQEVGTGSLWSYGSDLRRRADTSRVIVVVEPSGLVRYAPQGGAH